MGAIASLASSAVSVEPGAEARVELKVRNNGSVVDELTFSVLGAASSWSTVDPPSLSLFPGAEGTATVIFAPPREPSATAGPAPFGVRVASQEDAAGSTVEEGTITVAAFVDISAELQPHTSRGSRGAKHDLAVDNRGNATLNATVSGSDQEQALGFDIDPPGVVAEPGHAAFSAVAVKPRKSFWRGTPRTHQFVLAVEATGQPPVTVSGSLLQEPILPPWFLRALIALAAIIVALLALWFLVLQPTIIDAATERAEAVIDDAIASEKIAPGGGNGTGTGTGTGTETPGPVTPPTASTAPERPADGRLVPPGSVSRPSEGPTLHITDLIFSNPEGGAGTIRLKRDEDDLLVLRLENFRDLDFHFVTPITFGPGQALGLICDESCPGAAVYYSGFER
jgi:hypothetical protein